MSKDISSKHTFVVCAYRESQFLEDCVRSVLNQTHKSTVIMSTGTPNAHIENIARKYELKLIINEGPSNIANDFNFALECANTELVTLAHQDDIYEPEYSKKIVEAYQKASKPIILFSDYSELRDGIKVKTNTLLKIKRIMLFPLRFSCMWTSRFVRRRILSFGSAICCPAVTFVKSRMPLPLFENNMKSNIDWQAWELLSRYKGSFVYVPERLMAHRIHQESTTSSVLVDNARRQEDLFVFEKFWPQWIARLIEKVYQLSEKSNNL